MNDDDDELDNFWDAEDEDEDKPYSLNDFVSPANQQKDNAAWFSDLLKEYLRDETSVVGQPKKDIRLSEFETDTLVNELMARSGVGVVALKAGENAKIAFGGDLIDCLRLLQATEVEIKTFMEQQKDGEPLPDPDE